jgi:xylulose-5-phosphate/fructose-6-phosphate phosphoketolase
MALDSPNRVVVPIIGDGECETPATAASWLAQMVIPGAQVLPVVHLNGHRMGGPSLLGAMSDEQVSAYARGLGWEPVVAHVKAGSPPEHSAFHRALVEGIDAARRRERRVVFLRCVKGWSGPTGAHKTPLTDLKGDPHERTLLHRWMSSYRPHELFGDNAQPVGALASALDEIRFSAQPPCPPPAPTAATPEGRGFSAEVCQVLQAHAAAGDFKVFSPDELRSNRLGDLASEPWVHEVLAEEVLLGWLAGWTASGRRGVLISYEAFAPLLLTGLVGHLKQRRLADSALPSINLFLTSYGWHNAYTHGDPTLVTALLGIGDPAVHVFTPADANRTALALDDALRSAGQFNVIIAGKHPTPLHPRDTIEHERRHGLAVWEHLSDPGEPHLTIVCAGDLAAAVVQDAVGCIRDRHRCRVRVVNVHDLAALAGPTLHSYVGENASVLVATLGHPAAIWGLLRGRVWSMDVVGWREPPHPMPQDRLAANAGLDVAGITRAAATLLTSRGANGRND